MKTQAQVTQAKAFLELVAQYSPDVTLAVKVLEWVLS